MSTSVCCSGSFSSQAIFSLHCWSLPLWNPSILTEVLIGTTVLGPNLLPVPVEDCDPIHTPRLLWATDFFPPFQGILSLYRTLALSMASLWPANAVSVLHLQTWEVQGRRFLWLFCVLCLDSLSQPHLSVLPVSNFCFPCFVSQISHSISASPDSGWLHLRGGPRWKDHVHFWDSFSSPGPFSGRWVVRPSRPQCWQLDLWGGLPNHLISVFGHWKPLRCQRYSVTPYLDFLSPLACHCRLK